MNPYVVLGVGLLAQVLFSARLLIQWIASERAKRVLSPVIFWQLSMIASFLLCLYGWLRNDFAIISGQLVSYYICIWNLKEKGAWKKVHRALRLLFLGTPLAAVLWFLLDWDYTFAHLFTQEDIPVWLIVFGTLGQFTFTLRFVYQWWYSRRVGESVLPMNFWLISLTGSVMIISYALIRHDLVLILGQSTGVVAYTRNIVLLYRERVRNRLR